MPDNDNFTLKNSNEITRKLTLLFKTNSLITVSFNEGSLFFISTFIDIDLKKKKIRLDPAADEKINKQLISASNIFFESKVAGIYVSFTVPKVSKPLLGKNTSLILEFPTELTWQERRLFYRVKAPIQNTPTCQFTLDKANSNTNNIFHLLSFEVYDISLTGLSFIYDPAKSKVDIFSNIQQINECKIRLPDIDNLSLDVEMRGHHPLKASAPEKSQIIGLKFPTLTSAHESQIQRYLLSIERSRI